MNVNWLGKNNNECKWYSLLLHLQLNVVHVYLIDRRYIRMKHDFAGLRGSTNSLGNTISKIIFYIILRINSSSISCVSINFKINGAYCYNENVSKSESREFYFSRVSKFYCNYCTVISRKNCHAARFAFLFWTSWEIPGERNVQIHFLRLFQRIFITVYQSIYYTCGGNNLRICLFLTTGTFIFLPFFLQKRSYFKWTGIVVILFLTLPPTV